MGPCLNRTCPKVRGSAHEGLASKKPRLVGDQGHAVYHGGASVCPTALAATFHPGLGLPAWWAAPPRFPRRRCYS